MTRRRRWIGPLAVMLLAVAAAGGFGGYRLHARCDARETVHALAGMLSGQIGGAGVAIAAAHLLPGELWRFPYRCEAEYAPLRVTPELRDDQWHRVLFRVTRVGRALTVDLLAG